MSKILTIHVELDGEGRPYYNSADDLLNLFAGIDGGQVAGRILFTTISEPADPADQPIVAEVVEEVTERYVPNIRSVGELRRFLADIPDDAGFESYSGSVESLVNFSLNYGPSYDDGAFSDDDFVVRISNEN